MSPRRELGACVALALFLGSAVGCTTRPKAADGLLRIAMPDEVALDPHLAARPGGWVIARMLHRGLYAFPHAPHPGGSVPVPDLATDDPVLTGGARTATITLRDDVAFPTAGPLDAGDVVASVARLRRAGLGIARFLTPVEGVVALDARTVQFRLGRPMPELAWLLAQPQFAIVPANAPSPGSGKPQGLGPFRLESTRAQREHVFVRNSAWAQGTDPVRAPTATRVVVTIEGGARGAFDAVADGRADMIGDAGPPDAFGPGFDPGFESASRCVRLVAVNPNRSGLSDVARRRTIARALRGIRLPTETTARARGLLPPILIGGEQPADLPGTRTSPGRTLALAFGSTDRDRAEAARIAERLGDAGIAVRREPVDPSLLWTTVLDRRRFDLALLTWCAEWPGLAGRAIIEPLTEAPVPRSPTVAERLATAQRTAPGDGVEEAWGSAAGALEATGMLVPVGYPAEPAAFSSRIVDPMTSPMFPQGDPAHATV